MRPNLPELSPLRGVFGGFDSFAAVQESAIRHFPQRANLLSLRSLRSRDTGNDRRRGFPVSRIAAIRNRFQGRCRKRCFVSGWCAYPCFLLFYRNEYFLSSDLFANLA